jgi:hypothetical protein
MRTTLRGFIFSFCSLMRAIRSVSASSLNLSFCGLSIYCILYQITAHSLSSARLDAFWIDIRLFSLFRIQIIEIRDGLIVGILLGGRLWGISRRFRVRDMFPS